MATIALTDEELKRVDRICSELDPENHELTAPLLATVHNEEHRNLALTWLRRVLRSELIAGLIVRAAAEAVIEHGVATRAQAESEFREDWNQRYSMRTIPKLRSSTWQHGFGRVDFDTMNALHILSGFNYLKALLSEDQPVEADQDIVIAFSRIWTLVDTAHTRLFGMEEDLEALLLDDYPAAD